MEELGGFEKGKRLVIGVYVPNDESPVHVIQQLTTTDIDLCAHEESVTARERLNELNLTEDGLLVPLEKIEIGAKIGGGTFGSVHKGMLFGTDVAIKIVTIPEGDVKREAMKEVTSSDLHVFVCDLGVAKLQSKLAIHKTSRGPGAGTVAYKAPEMFRDSRRSTPVDIYSFGCVIIELFTDALMISTGAHRLLRGDQTRISQSLRSFTPADNAQVKDLAISSDGQLFASSSVNDRSVVYRLNCSLVAQEALWIAEGSSVLGLILTPDDIVVCTTDKSCTSYDASNLNDGSTKVFADVLASSNSSVALVRAPIRGGGNSFYVGSSDENLNLIGQYGIDGTARNVSRSSGGLFGVTTDTFTRDWFSGFVAGFYVYFVVLDVSASPNSETGIRVLRVCDNSQETRVTSVSEIELDCLDLAGRVNGYARLVGASLVTYPVNGSQSYETALLVGIVTPPLGGYSGMYSGRVCAFQLSQIDSMIDSVSSSSPSNGTCFSGPLPWRNTSNSYFSCSSRCNMSSPGATEAPTLHAVSHPVSVLSTNTSFELDYVLSIYIESLSLLFIASTNHMDTSILQAFHVVDGSANSTGNWFSSWVLPQRAVKLTWVSELSYIYVTTNISVSHD
eukprot:Em0021g721a